MLVAKLIRPLFLVLLTFAISCKKSENNFHLSNNDGGYSLEFLNIGSVKSDSLTIYGSFYDLKTKEPLGGSTVRFYCKNIMTDTGGYFYFKLNSRLNSEYFFKGISIGYKTVITDSILLMSDSLQLNFYLEKDDTPIYNCDN